MAAPARPGLIVCAASAVALATLLPAWPAAAAAPVRCGATLTSSTTLTRDLTCAGNGLTLAPGVRLDLGGHRLTGNGTGSGVRALASTATTVRNGQIRGWSLGVEFEGATPYPDQPLVLDKLAVRDAPVQLTAAITTVTRSSFVRSDLRLYENDFTATATVLDHSSTVGELNRVTLRRSTVLAGGVGVDENNEVTLVDSTLDGTSAPREAVGCYGRRTVIGTTIRDYATPVYVYDSCPTLIDRSTFVDNPAGALLSPEPGAGLVVTASTFRSNAFGVSGRGVTVTGSTFERNGDGVHLDNGDGSVVASSRFTSNSRSGVVVDAGSLRIGGVRSDRNGEYGIYAPTAIDLGGNRARGNGKSDCVGVTCGP